MKGEIKKVKNVKWKSILGISLLCILSFGFKVEASNDTGYSNFDQIEIPEGSTASLLIHMLPYEKEKAMKQTKWKFFGWSIYNINYRQPVKYTAYTIFSRANRTSEKIDFQYTVKIGESVSNSVTITGNLGVKTSSKIKAISLGVDANIKGEWEKIIKKTKEEQTEFTVKILPNTKVSLLVKGVAELTNGASKYYTFGIPMKKGYFEFIDIVTEYYELYEEKVG